MPHNDDAFATMLLMSQLSADKEEIVRPYSVAEYYRLRDRVAACSLGRLGNLIGMDLSGIRRALKLDEPEAYRLCVLLNRIMPLSYALERFAESGIDITTLDEADYPARLSARLGCKAPPMLYSCGDRALAAASSIVVIGNSCARSDVLECAGELAELACECGVTLVCGGENGFGRQIEREAFEKNGRVISFLAESLAERIYQPGLSEMIATKRALAVSMLHPDAKYTAAHALERNKCLYALSNAAFVISCEKGKGAAWEGACSALRNRYVDRVYVWNHPEISGNRELIARGALAFQSPRDIPLRALKAEWERPDFEQMSMF